MNSDNLNAKYILKLSVATVSILCIPFIAMQFTEEVNWTFFDYIIAGFMIFGTGLFCKVIILKAKDTIYKIAIGFALLTGFALIWVNLAVGLVGSEDNPANLMYFGVIAVGLIGAFSIRFKSRKMVYVMFSMTLAQGIIAAIILTRGLYQTPPNTIVQIIGVNSFFMVLFTVSGLLFRYAHLESAEPETAVN